MINDPAEPVWRLVRVFLGVGAGIVVLFGLVLVTAWAATMAAGLGPDDAPTNPYLVMNLAGNVVAAVLAGMVAAGVARTIIAPLALAGLLLALGAAAGGQAAAGQPAWYPVAVTLMGAAGVALGGWVAPRRSAGDTAPDPAPHSVA